MKKIILIVAGFLISATMMKAQEYKVARSTGKLVISEVNNVSIEGYNGNEVVFTSLDGTRKEDKRAEGLRAISAMGLEDNTGMGLAVQEKGNTIEVYQMKKMGGPRVKIMVPKGVSVSISHTSPHGNTISLKNVESELEVSTVHSGIQLDNITGPMTLKTVHGKIEAVLSTALKSPISMVAVHGLVDITLPIATKANVSLTTTYGEIFVDPAIKIEFEGQNEWVRYGSNKVSGKINGGGLDLTLSSTHNNVYVRKK